TDFITGAGSEGYAYDIVRSKAGDLIFNHTNKSGAHKFGETKVTTIEFAPTDESWPEGLPSLGRPVSAAWSHKDGKTGVIELEDLIDASGRIGIVATKFYKLRTGVISRTLATMAWASTRKVSLASGWFWTIPLHDGTTSVSVVRNQAVATQRKKEMESPSSKDYYLDCLQSTPVVKVLGDSAELNSDIKSSSDWSYSASGYFSSHIHILRDAGCFVDAFFSSDVHLALSNGLSVATTIYAARRGDCDEVTAAEWHSKKVAEGYTRFFLIVLSALKQIREANEAVLSDFYDRASAFFRPSESLLHLSLNARLL
ncbi:MAG: hypothetical protein Q9173_007345, partial [Seirophora scorigena]